MSVTTVPGEYRVNFGNGGEKTARFADDFDEALELGRAMAAEAAAQRVALPKPPRRRKRRPNTGTAKRRRRRYWARKG